MRSSHVVLDQVDIPRGAWPSGDGRLHRGDVAARVHLRACPPARQGDRRGPRQGVSGGCRPRGRAAGSGCGLHHVRGAWLPQAGGRLLRLHPPPGLPPAAGDPRRRRRGAARPAAQGRGQHCPRHPPLRDELVCPAAPRRRQRRADLPHGLGILVGQAHPAATRHRVRYSITVRQTKTVRAAIAQIPEPAWVQIAYTPEGSPRSPRQAIGATG
jgi:hypothetical protein